MSYISELLIQIKNKKIYYFFRYEFLSELKILIKSVIKKTIIFFKYIFS